MTDVAKGLKKDGLNVGKPPVPTYWFGTGNYVLNKIISGSFMKGIPQGRITAFTGPSGHGKSFNVANAMAQAQKDGALVVCIDTEGALDDDFVTKLGVDVDPEVYTYVEASTLGETKKVVSRIVKQYRSVWDRYDPDADKMLIVIDSLNMLMTENEQKQFDAGENKGDQGQKNKQVKAMLQSFVNNIKGTNITFVVTAQVYQNQDILNGKGVWVIPDAVQYACSQIVLLTKLNLKHKETKKITGIKMKCFGFKTRFAKPYESVTIEVPYEDGMDPYNGLLDVAVAMDIIKKGGAWYTMSDGTKFQEKNSGEHMPSILEQCENVASEFHLEAIISDDFVEAPDEGESGKKQRKAKFDADNADPDE